MRPLTLVAGLLFLVSGGFFISTIFEIVASFIGTQSYGPLWLQAIPLTFHAGLATAGLLWMLSDPFIHKVGRRLFRR